MSNPFEYRTATHEELQDMDTLRVMLMEVYEQMLTIPSSSERVRAIRKLQEAGMWANLAILGSTL